MCVCGTYRMLVGWIAPLCVCVFFSACLHNGTNIEIYFLILKRSGFCSREGAQAIGSVDGAVKR